MDEANPLQRIQVTFEKTLVGASYLFGLATSAGYVKCLRNPWVRAASLTAVAATQALEERDRQIQTRQKLIELQRKFKMCDPKRLTEVQAKVGDEVERRLVILYNPTIVLYKSLLEGATLGLLRPLIFCSYTLTWPTSPLYQQDHTEDMSLFFFMFCHDISMEPKEEPTLQEWRSSPQCWYERHGKQPIFPFKVEY